MILIRIEHGLHRSGPWATAAGRKCLDEDSNRHCPSNGPGWSEDIREIKTLGYSFRADDWRTYLYRWRQLKLWFGPAHIAALNDAGFVLAVYKLPRWAVKRGHWQAIGKHSTAKHVRDFSLIDIFPQCRLLSIW